jgi:hypothetical protein
VTAPQLDAFGNETVPIFNSTYQSVDLPILD